MARAAGERPRTGCRPPRSCGSGAGSSRRPSCCARTSPPGCRTSPRSRPATTACCSRSARRTGAACAPPTWPRRSAGNAAGSHHLGRMERRGLIRREDCAADSRGAEIIITDEGAEAFHRAALPHLRRVSRCSSALSRRSSWPRPPRSPRRWPAASTPFEGRDGAQPALDFGCQPAGGSSPTRPSTASRSRSAWPVCRPYSSIRSRQQPPQADVAARRRRSGGPAGRAHRPPAPTPNAPATELPRRPRSA